MLGNLSQLGRGLFNDAAYLRDGGQHLLLDAFGHPLHALAHFEDAKGDEAQRHGLNDRSAGHNDHRKKVPERRIVRHRLSLSLVVLVLVSGNVLIGLLACFHRGIELL